MVLRHVRGGREPLLAGSVALAVLQFVVFAVDFRRPVVPDFLVALPQLTLTGLTAAALWQAWRVSRDRMGRRFWRGIATGLTVACVGQLIDVRSFAGGPTPPPEMLQSVYVVVPMLCMMWALYRLPLGARNRGERQRLLLDISTVALAAALFVWYFSHSVAASSAAAQHEALTAVVLIILAVMLFGVVKILMSGTRAVDPLALRLYSVALLLEVAGMLLAPLVATRPHYSIEVCTRAAGFVVTVLAATQERRAACAAATGRTRADRPFSVLPYLAVASVDLLLLATLRGQDSGRLMVGVVAVALTALVTIRQVAAFRDNARLLGQLGRQERRFRSLVQNAVDVVAICDRNGVVGYVSPGIEQLLGCTAEQIVGTTGPRVHPDDLASATAAFRAVLDNPDGTSTYEMRAQHADGTWRRVRITITNLLHDAAVGGIVSNIRDITEAFDYHRQLSHQASHDALTDLANRSLLGQQMAKALADRDGRPACLALVDLDDFKAVNDTLGHHAGDVLLVAVAERLRRGVRPADLVARLGGDEFAVLLDGAGAPNVDAIAARMLDVLTEPLRIDGHDVFVQASIGLAEAGPDDDVEALMRHADLALYEAKGAGKGRYVRYSPDLRPRMAAQLESAAELRRALAAGEFELHYQPIVTLPAGKMSRVEALLRWRHPQRGLVPPLDFLPIAEQTSMIVPIGRWVLGQACRDAAAWLAAYPQTAPQTINVNISPLQLGDPGFVDDVIAALDAAALPASRLVLELVESAVVGDIADQLRRLREHGVRIALDDFGTGHSTLSLLDSCPVDELKLDRSFVREAGQDKVATAVARIGQILRLDVVAEGVETPEQAEHLHALGYALAQGFHFARPVPAASIRDMLELAPATV